MTGAATPEFLTLAPVIPVVTFADPGIACDVAQALLRGGVGVIEVTLRNQHGLTAIAAIARGVPQMCTGAGTVLSPDDLHAAADAGAAFAVSPGSTPRLLAAAQGLAIPYLPAISTASELMAALEAGYRHLKFFPAAMAGGMELLRALASPFPQARFCATGGITAETARTYLQLPHVLCVGGSWLTPAEALARRDWTRIERLAAQTAALRAAVTRPAP
ncbi:MAG TPA: bifunctional 4-hydroxy-2-oxoglutarate aldolase/2-dehydro-3-deoxy-phosphogluconate aldolase [Steroidobacteraceae bacterium]|nr:bifunctional 4-hydroxy-2-oxoglutarate aldolase/2-dehydro-3-deoxy-phosphogluconate aldolase [Steroidobacteraceae bacterium]